MNLQHKFWKPEFQARTSAQGLNGHWTPWSRKSLAMVDPKDETPDIRDDGKRLSKLGRVNTSGTPTILSSGSENGASKINTGGTQTNKGSSSGGGKRKREPKHVVPDSEGQDDRKVTRRSLNGVKLGLLTASVSARRGHSKSDVKTGPPAQHHSGPPWEGQDPKTTLRSRSLNGGKTGSLTNSKSAGRVPSMPGVDEGPPPKHHSETPL